MLSLGSMLGPSWEIHRRKAPHKLGNTLLGPFKPCDIRDGLLRFFGQLPLLFPFAHLAINSFACNLRHNPTPHLLSEAWPLRTRSVCVEYREITHCSMCHRHRHSATSLRSSSPRLFQSRNHRNTWLFPPFCDKPFGAQGAYPPSNSLTLSGLEPQQIVGIDPSRHRSLRKRITAS